MQSDNPTAGILVIGDEILSGRTREGNAHYLAKVLTASGLDLREIRVVPDDHQMIVTGIRAMDSSLGGAWDHLFTSGGIGPTHDDITADAVGAAFGVSVDISPEARQMLADRYQRMGLELTENRLRMARIPAGAQLIRNTVSGAPGFTIGRTHVLAGVPEVFRAMVDAVIPTLEGGRPTVSLSVEVRRGESDVAEDLKSVAEAWDDLSFGSYPFQSEGRWGTNLVVRGLDPDRVTQGMAALRDRLGL